MTPSPDFDKLLRTAQEVAPQGVSEAPPPQEEEEVKPSPEEKPVVISGEWGAKCQMRDQLTNPKYAGSWRTLPLQFETYNILLPEDKKKLNELLLETSPGESPSVKIDQSQTYQVGDKLLVVVYFTRIEYKKVTQDV